MQTTAGVSSGAATHSAPPRPAWRTDIEGLRGVAVLLVVLFHAAVPGFSGGYVGVDVFFVLSGYLITGILVREAEETGTIDLPRFYARRARRLLPAVALLLAFVAAFAFVFYAPLAQREIAKTAIATAAYLSNVFFGRRATDYWAAEAEANPLLHAWSLSVEEQFYLIWPALVLLLFFGSLALRRGRGEGMLPSSRGRLIGGTAALAAGSFVLTLYFMGSGGAHWAFFSSPTRVWEFALGGLGVLVPRLQLQREGQLAGLSFDPITDRVPAFAQAAGWAGLVAIVVSGVVYTAHTPFPGWAAMLPVLGTVCVLRAGTAGTETALARALSWRPLRVLGRLSYSWYLWHWPVLVFASGLYGELPLVTRLLLLVVALGLAAASYRLVENPVRYSRTLGQRPVYGLALLAILTAGSLSLAGAWWAVAKVQMQRPEQVRYMTVRSDIADLVERGCHTGFSGTRPAGCSDGPEDAAFTVALYGDSHAAQWAPALQALASRRGWRLVYLTKSSCPGIHASFFLKRLGRFYTECDAWRSAALDTVRSIRPDLVVTSSESAYPFSLDEWEAGSARMFADLAAASDAVVALRDVPRPHTDVTLCLAQRAWQRDIGVPAVLRGQSCDFSASDSEQVAVHEAQVEAAKAYENVHVVDLTGLLCPGGVCRVETGEHVMYRDRHHLSASYASSMAGQLEKALRSAIGGSRTSSKSRRTGS